MQDRGAGIRGETAENAAHARCLRPRLPLVLSRFTASLKNDTPVAPYSTMIELSSKIEMCACRATC